MNDELLLNTFDRTAGVWEQLCYTHQALGDSCHFQKASAADLMPLRNQRHFQQCGRPPYSGEFPRNH